MLKSPPGVHRYLYLLEEEELRAYDRSGYTLYSLDRFVEKRQRERAGIDLRDHGLQRLF